MSRHAKRKSSKLKRPKTKLGLPDLDHSKSAVLDSLRLPESKRGYRHAIDEFIQWYCSEPRLSFNKVVGPVAAFSSRIASSRQERSMDDSLQYGGSPTRLPTLACSVRSSPPASRRVKGARKLGVRLGNWLTTDEARRLWQAPDPDTIKGKRDRATLAILLGCGLRRRELADLEFTHIQQRETIGQSSIW